MTEQIRLEIYNKLKSIHRRRNDNLCIEIATEIDDILDKYKQKEDNLQQEKASLIEWLENEIGLQEWICDKYPYEQVLNKIKGGEKDE